MFCNQFFLAFLLYLKLHDLSQSAATSIRMNSMKSEATTSDEKNSGQSDTPSTKLNNINSAKQLIIESIAQKISNLHWKQKVSKVEWPSSAWLSDVPTNTIRCRIFCRSGYHLQIRRNGAVSGTLAQNSKYTLFEIQSFGPSIIRIKSVATGHYLIMKRNGCIRGSKTKRSAESLFREKQEENAFNSYASEKYFQKRRHDMLIGIKHNGKIKRATKSHHGQQATQFLIIRL